uniref:Uncharacterized protein n=1 Tax=Ciona intestinalis TaxID=7719 RepID=H2Y2N6_CIOIN
MENLRVNLTYSIWFMYNINVLFHTPRLLTSNHIMYVTLKENTFRMIVLMCA